MKLKFEINGEVKECDVLYTFKSDNTNKDYLVCTDNTYSVDGLNLYSFIYYPDDKARGMVKIESEEDWMEVENFIKMAEVSDNE